MMNMLRSLMVSIYVLLALFMMPVGALAAFSSGSTGADGDFNPTTNTVLQIPESGIFNFGTVNIPSGVTITFTKNSQNTPATILATGNVLINGTINLNGGNGSFVIPGAGGPGGFYGGTGGTANNSGRRGEGPGGGLGGPARTCCAEAGGNAGGGGFAGNGGTGNADISPSGAGGPSYGNERALPLIGGSGGGGGGGTNGYVGGGGGGGGGAIVIASSGTITVNGSITANGGGGANGESQDCYWWGCNWGFRGGAGGGGAGGSIRLVANTITGNGPITATGGGGGRGWHRDGGGGSAGRIRLEMLNTTRTSGTSPPMTFGAPYAVTPANMPTLTIKSIGGLDVPPVPSGGYRTPDVTLPLNTQNPVSVVVAAANIPAGTTVTVKSIPEVGTENTSSGTLSGTDTSSTASINLNISTAYPSVIMASVMFQLTASNGGPIYADGERVDKIRVAANLGGGSAITYITESGREIPAAM